MKEINLMQLEFTETLIPPRRKLARFVPPKRFPLREKISVSFSGGKTSAYMLAMILDAKKSGEIEQEIVVTFCNTGLEHEETLRFVQKCDEHFNAGIVWIEAVVTHGERVGIRHRIVNFETASRKGEPFEEYIKKHGIPNQAMPQCNSRLKLDVMESYRRSIGWKLNTYSTAIGIRCDEMDRISWQGMERDGIFYPCIDAGIFKRDVAAFWEMMPFNLNIPEHYGNCVTCWKKSDRKLLTIAKENPSAFDFMDRMEGLYGFAGGERRDGGEKQRRVFFRKNRTAQDILALSSHPFTPFVDGKFIPFDDDLDVGSGCGESCEIGAD
jgi:hypothetical protein